MTLNVTDSKIDLIEENSELTNSKIYNYLIKLGKLIGILGCLYFFVVSLNLMSTSFPLIAGRYASEAFRSSVVLTNPFAGLMLGVLSTVLVQSSSTSTSIVVSLVASEIVPVKYAIPIIMGSNIGTSITSTLVALSQASDKERFRLSFAGATVHDMFNLLSVAVLMPIEMCFRYLEVTSGFFVELIVQQNPHTEEPKFLNAMTKPLTDSIIQIDKNILDSIATNKSFENATLIKRLCKKVVNNKINESKYEPCSFLFSNVYWPEWLIGSILLFVSLFILSGCLFLLVKILSSLLNGPVAKVIQKVVNSDFPGVFKHMTGFVAITLGCILTMAFQSSSVFTSTLTPLVGMGLVTIERVFPLTLGSNIGTTITGILASLSGPTRTLKYSMQIALCHSIFNISGILLWYPLPVLRRVPIKLAKMLGDTTAEYRWFAIAYLIGFFFLVPIITFGLSLLGMVVFGTVLCLVLGIIFGLILLKILQQKIPENLPKKLRSFDFLPQAFRSLKPYDNFIKKYFCFMKCCHRLRVHEPITDTHSPNENPTVTFSNSAFDKQFF